MKPSVFNRLIRLGDETTLLVNTLSGALDVAPTEACALVAPVAPVAPGACGVAPSGLSPQTQAYLAQRGYLLPPDQDELCDAAGVYARLAQARRQADHLQAVMVLGFGCNLRCTYCWQRQQIDAAPEAQAAGAMTRQQAEAALAAIPELGRRLGLGDEVVVQLFGGEPLLPAHQPVAEYLLAECAARGWGTQITTNGSYLRQFLPVLRAHGVGEIQVTVDGPAPVHEARRVGSRFGELMDSLDTLLAETEIRIKMRVNVDPENLEQLPALAEAIMDRQWYANRNFHAYLAPLRDGCGLGDELLRARPALLARLLEMRQALPRLEVFDMLGWDGYQSAWIYAQAGRLPLPKVFVCDAGRNQVVFSPSGLVHTCAEEAHNPESAVGRYDPELAVDEAALRAWLDPTPLAMAGCGGCSLLPQCGGGCRLLDRRPGARQAFCAAVAESFDMGLRQTLDREGACG